MFRYKRDFLHITIIFKGLDHVIIRNTYYMYICKLEITNIILVNVNVYKIIITNMKFIVMITTLYINIII